MKLTRTARPSSCRRRAGRHPPPRRRWRRSPRRLPRRCPSRRRGSRRPSCRPCARCYPRHCPSRPCARRCPRHCPSRRRGSRRARSSGDEDAGPAPRDARRGLRRRRGGLLRARSRPLQARGRRHVRRSRSGRQPRPASVVVVEPPQAPLARAAAALRKYYTGPRCRSGFTVSGMRPPDRYVLAVLLAIPFAALARNRLQQRQRTDRRASDGRPRHALQGQRRRRRRDGRRRVPDGIRARRRGRARARCRRAVQRLRRDAVQRRGRRRRLQVPREVDRDGDPRQAAASTST